MAEALRKLVVNADDFGMSPGINRGIVEAHERGIVTSASLMVRSPHAREAVEQAREHPALGLGLHVDLGEWVFEDGRWRAVYEVVPQDDAAAVEREIRRQVAEYRTITGRDPDHVDSHQHVHRSGAAQAIAVAVVRELDVPLRHFTPGVHYNGDFYGQGPRGEPLHGNLEVASLVAVLQSIPAEFTELACHPGYADGVVGAYHAEREMELRTLCDGRVRDAVRAAGIRLCTFADFKASGENR